MMRRFAFILICSVLVYQDVRVSRAGEGQAGPAGEIWTAIIPDAFPRYVYTWHLQADSSYREDGRDSVTGIPIQQTLSGRWQRNDFRLRLEQGDQSFVFDGVVMGHTYVGTLYFNQRAVSRFCAAEGEQPPLQCGTGPGVAAAVP